VADDLDKLADKLGKLFETLVDADDSDVPRGRRRYESLRHLWKTDEPDWLAQRKAEWRLLVEDGFCDGCDAKTLKAWQAFYLSGEEPPVGAVFSSVSRVIMTPFTTPEEAKALVELITHPEDRSRVLSGYMEMACSRAQRMSWLRERIGWFIDGVLGRSYQRFEMEQGRRIHVVSPEPTSFCWSFTANAIKLFSGELHYSFTVDTVPFFLSVLPLADNPKIRKRVKLAKMLEEAARVLEEDQPQGYALELARQLKQHEDEILRSWKLHEESGSSH
jgi:hypothetical protein